ncbi:MAG: NusA-like transcription termination signal-binding factor [Candidatus Aenigmarchaeota archaeon]|nr:NusA-like transcription termination signal-binding factor [Candidatus Aenigmarchaeota archaeon]MCX8179258.1 NusA-like transcription termination signal-binding factor [Candidatus Aenigmarchaeota archaeon]
MKRRLDTNTIRFLNLFENITNVRVVDCFENGNTIYYIVEEGKAGLAVGKKGHSIKYVEKILGKHVKVYEYSSDAQEFIKNLIPVVLDVKIIEENEKNIAEIKINKKDIGVVMGRNKEKFKILKEILKRLHNIDDIRLK